MSTKEISSRSCATSTTCTDDDMTVVESDSFSRPSVRFAQQIEIFELPHLDNQSKGDIEKLWYVSEEYAVFNYDCLRSARKLEKASKTQLKKLNPYGLEAWTRHGLRRRLTSRIESVDTVLDEQFAQWDDQVEDQESIAEMYRSRSQHAKMIAVTRGLMLEREVHGDLVRTVSSFPGLFETLSRSERSLYSVRSKLSRPLTSEGKMAPKNKKSTKKSESVSPRQSQKTPQSPQSASTRSLDSLSSQSPKKSTENSPKKSSSERSFLSPTKITGQDSLRLIRVSKNGEVLASKSIKSRRQSKRILRSPLKKKQRT